MRAIPRTDLAGEFAADLGDHLLGVIEGGPGFGKTALLRAVVAAWPHDAAAWPAGGPAEAALMLRRPRPILIHVDDADALPARDRAALVALVADLPSRHRLVLATRGRPGPLRQMADQAPGPRVGPARLLLSADDIARRLWGVVPDPGRVGAAVHAATGGWAEGAQAMLAIVSARDAQLAEEDAAAEWVAELVAERVAGLPAAQRAALCRALSLPRMREMLLSHLAGGADVLGAALDARVPLCRQEQDAWVLPEPLGRLLPAEPLETAEIARPAMLARRAGHLDEAFALLWHGGQADAAMDLLERASGRDAARMLAGWRAPVDLPPRHLATVPRAAERLLRAAERAGHPDHRSLVRQEEAAAAYGVVLDGRLRALATRTLLERGHTGCAHAAAAALVGQTANPAALAMALEVLGRAARRRGTAEDLRAAEDLLKESLALWRRVDDPDAIAEARLRLAWLDHDRGVLARALLRASAVREAAATGGALWAQAALMEADLRCDAGFCDAAEALLEQIRVRCGPWAGPRIHGRMAVLRARAAVHRQRWDEARDWANQVSALPLAWMDGAHGVRNVAMATEIWSRLGDADRAAQCLKLLGTLQVEPTVQVAIATADVAARHGDAALALADLRALAADPAVPPRETWRIWLLAALAASRASPQDVPALIAAALRAATAVGQPFAPFVRERETVHTLLRMGGLVLGGAG